MQQITVQFNSVYKVQTERDATGGLLFLDFIPEPFLSTGLPS